jgi:ABC-type polysaccharide/polyol phosphate export permease
VEVSWPTAALAVPRALLTSLAVAPIAALLLAGTIPLKQVTAGAGWVVSAISLLAGVYFPVTLLPGWIRWVSDLLPLTPALALLRHVLVGTPTPVPVLDELARLSGFAVLGVPLAALALGAACTIAHARGTLHEY